MGSVPPAALRDLARRSVEVITEHQDVGGAYPASPTFPVYRFSWLRDGSFIADAMSRAGELESADRFFGWCARVVTDRADQIHELVGRARSGGSVARSEHLPTRYTLDGHETSEEWWDFQLDGYGTWMWALVAHRARVAVGDPSRVRPVDPAVAEAVALCVEYLTTFWPQPCFDWWEEHPDGVHPSTLGAIHAGLRSVLAAGLVPDDLIGEATATVDGIEALVAERGVLDGHLVKMLDDGPRVDASLIACCTPFGLVDPAGSIADATYEAVVRDLAPDGVHRYLGDTFYGGGRWVVLAGFLGWHEAATGRVDEARRRLEWMWAQRTPEGLLPEQVHDHPLDPNFVSVWEAKWGPVATPLLWSHAMYLTLADTLGLLSGDR
jgi:GH15 family glucan-1,4-alpha-glucosidase